MSMINGGSRLRGAGAVCAERLAKWFVVFHLLALFSEEGTSREVTGAAGLCLLFS